jgi:hypothetical protein
MDGGAGSNVDRDHVFEGILPDPSGGILLEPVDLPACVSELASCIASCTDGDMPLCGGSASTDLNTLSTGSNTPVFAAADKTEEKEIEVKNDSGGNIQVNTYTPEYVGKVLDAKKAGKEPPEPSFPDDYQSNRATAVPKGKTVSLGKRKVLIRDGKYQIIPNDADGVGGALPANVVPTIEKNGDKLRIVYKKN